MRSRTIRFLSIATVCVAWTLMGGTADAQSDSHDHAHAAIGKPAPMFTLKDTTGKTHSLEDILKKEDTKAVVLEWFNHTCPVCTRHGVGKTMSKLVDKYKDKGVVWFGIDSTHSNEGKESEINETIKKWGVNYPILTDFNGKVGHIYGAKTTPHMFIIDKKGAVVYTGAIDDDHRGKKPETERTVYVADALDQVLAGETVANAQNKSYGCSVKYKQ
ncbi:MAG: redoxin domain-containing protein [Planctomycetes bacterium]|nr:redoxin domain-containing protein [Planctomycetota bacterium]